MKLIIGLIVVAIIAFVGLFMCFSTRDEVREQAQATRSEIATLKDGLAGTQDGINELAARFDAEEFAPKLPENRDRLGF